ncbi:MAG: helix-turn-helix domain-containing protein [Patescibacteria group bacterium]
MSKYPKVNFVVDPLDEARGMLFAAIRIKECFYKDNNLKIVTKLGGTDQHKEIVFPKFCSEIVEDFWQRIPHSMVYQKNNYKNIEQIIKIIKDYIEQNNLLPDKKYIVSLKDEWLKIETEYWRIWRNVFTKKTNKELNEYRVFVTNWGHIMSFGSDINIVLNKGEVCLRMDASIDFLARGIMATTLWDHLLKQEYLYNEQVVIFDFLMTETGLARLFPDYKQYHLFFNQLNKFNYNYTKRTLSKLNFTDTGVISFWGDSLFFRKKPAQYKLVKEELELLKYLKENNGRVCGIREIAHIIWRQNYAEKFSLWALNALVYRLRKKLAKNKINPNIIETIRGQGIRLNDI